jgi:hypothetical protein
MPEGVGSNRVGDCRDIRISMSAVWMLARKDLRRSWRSAVFLVVLVAVVGTVVFATAAGARRSDTALARFTAFSEPSDLSYLTGFAYKPTPAEVAAVRAIPGVEAMNEIRFYAARTRNMNPNVMVGADVVTGAVDRTRLIRGRYPSPDATNEVALDEAAAALGARVGTTLDFDTYTQAQVNGSQGGPPPVALGPAAKVTVVGITRVPVDLGTTATQQLIELPPAWDRAYVDRAGNLGAIFDLRTAHGTADRAQVTAAMQKIFGTQNVSAQSSVQSDAQRAQSAIDALTLALWIIAAVAAIAGLVTIAIVLNRDVFRASEEQPTLNGLGLTRLERMLVFGPRVALVAVSGAALSFLGAIAISPRFPIGLARRADPNLGVHVDWFVLGLGFVAVLLAVLAIAAVVTARVTRVAVEDRHARRSVVVESATRASASPTLTNGLRLAFEPGRGRTAVPVRTAFVGAIVAVVGVTAALVFAISLQQLVSTPTRYGWTWRIAAADSTFTGSVQDCKGVGDGGLSKLAGVGAIAALCADEIQVGSRPVYGWAFTPLRGTIPPAVIAGRAPTATDEIALGPQTMSALRTHIGTSVTVHGAGGASSYHVVGEAIFADARDGTPLADGALFTQAGLTKSFDPNNQSYRYLVADVVPGADPARVAAAIRTLPNLNSPATRVVPAEISRLDAIRGLPFVLAALLAALGAIAIGHALVTGTRRRRHDLALLKTLGFTRRQVERTVAWQATALAVVGLLVGLPVGWLIGRALWTQIEHHLGVVSPAHVGAVTIALIAIATIVVANVIAWLPARAAARLRAGIALRSE